MPSFIDSPFPTRKEFEDSLKLPEAERLAAEEAMRQKIADVTAGMESASVDEAAADSWGPLEFPPARKEALHKDFTEAAGSKGRLDLKTVHKMLFLPEERMEYDFDNFDQDLQATCEGCKDDMGWEDVLKFMEENL